MMIRLDSMGVAMLMLIAAGPVHAATAAQTVSASAIASCATEPADPSSYRLQAGDVLGIDFRFTPELNASATIRPDGRFAMSGIGDLTAAGQTTRQLTCALQSAYSSMLREPIISISVRPVENPSFIVGGEVERPGKFELRSDTTIAEAIAIAGGFKRSAKQSTVFLFRRGAGPDDTTSRVIDVRAMLDKGEIAQDVRLQRDDMLFVPQSGWSRIERFIPVPGIGLFVPVR